MAINTGGAPIDAIRLGTGTGNVAATSVRVGTGTGNVEAWTAFAGYRDTFDRAALGPDWTTYGPAVQIVGGALKASSTAGTGKACYGRELPGDDMTTGVTIGAVTDDVQKTTLRLGTDPAIDAADYRTYVCVNVNATSWEVVTRDPAYVTRASGAWRLADGNTVELSRKGDTVTLTRNGARVWSDTFAQPPTGPGRRYCSVDLNNYFSGGIFGKNYYSPTLDQWWATS